MSGGRFGFVLIKAGIVCTRRRSMARVAGFLFGICVFMAVTSVQAKLSMHQQHLRMHQQMFNKKHKAGGTPKQYDTARETPKPVNEASLSQSESTGQHSESEAQPKKPPEAHIGLPKKEMPRPDEVTITTPAQEVPKSKGGASKEARDSQKGSVAKSSGPEKQTSKEPHSMQHTISANKPVTEKPNVKDDEHKTSEEHHSEPHASQEDAKSENGERLVVPDEEVIFIDGGSEEARGKDQPAQTYPDPDLDNEDGGIGDLAGEDAHEVHTDQEEREENEEEEDEDEREEEEDYHHDDDQYDQWSHHDEPEHKHRPREEGELIRPLVYDDLESVLSDEQYVMMHFVSAGCEKCEKFKPHYQELAKRFWLMGDDSAEQINIYFYEVTDHQLLVRFNLRVLPTVFFFRNGVPILYEGDLNTDALQSWTFAHLKVSGWALTDENFDDQTKGTKDKESDVQWLVHFCDVDAVGCDGFMATWESAASRMKGEVLFGYVDVGVEITLAKRFNVDLQNLPAIVLLKHGQAFWCTLPLIELTTDSLVHFAKEGHVKIQKEEVPSKLSALAALIVQAGANIKGISSMTVATVLVLYLVYVCVCRRRPLKDTGKQKGV